MDCFDKDMWERLCEEAAAEGASDLHIAAGQPVFLRVNGELHRLDRPHPEDMFLAELLRELLSDEQAARFAEQGELDFAYSFGRQRFRINVFRGRGNLAMACRLIPKDIPTLEALGAPKVFDRLLQLKHGLILVCGPTGSGKTTTLAAYLNTINTTRAEHILTLEDPIEYLFESDRSLVQQREYGVDFFSFADALRSALRENPDILLVGELRDADTVATALHAAETGILVLGSLHTHTAAEALLRMESFFPAEQQEEIRTQLSVVLEAVVTQQLLPVKNGGRTAASEVLASSPAVGNLIRSGKVQQLESVMLAGGGLGMQTMPQAIEQLKRQNII